MTTTTVQPVGTLYAPTPSTTSSPAATTAATKTTATTATTATATTTTTTSSSSTPSSSNSSSGTAATSGSGFDATLQNKVQVAFRVTRTVAGVRRPGMDAGVVLAPLAGGAPPAGTVLKVDQPCGSCPSLAKAAAAPGGYGWQFSFFARVAGDLGEWGTPMQASFFETGRAVADTFVKQVGWSGDPVGAFLLGTDQVMQAGPAATGSFFDSLRRRATQGLESLSSSLLAVQSGIGLPSLSGNSVPASPLTTTGALDLARLHINSAATATQATAQTRPRLHNREGVEITLVSGPLPSGSSGRVFQDPIRSAAQVKLTGDQTRPPDAALDFLKKFLDLVRSFLEDLGRPAAPAATIGSGEAPVTDAAPTAADATEGDSPSPSPAENPPAEGDAPAATAALVDPDAPTTVI